MRYSHLTMFLIDVSIGALTFLRVYSETTLKGDCVVILIGLARKDQILLRGQLAVQAIHTEVHSVSCFLHWREQQLRLAYRHRIY